MQIQSKNQFLVVPALYTKSSSYYELLLAWFPGNYCKILLALVNRKPD